jgi:hypothetical protein
MWCAHLRRQSMMVMQMVAQLGTEHNTLQERMNILGYLKVCCCWVPRSLADEHNRHAYLYLHSFFIADGDVFLLNILSWWKLTPKRQSTEWHHAVLPKKITARTILEDLREKFSGIPRGAYWLISCSERKLSTQFAPFGRSKKMWRAVPDKRLMKKHVILQLYNALSHIAHLTSREIQKFGR